MSVGENIKSLRKQASLTQRQLADLTDLNEVTIRSYELEKYMPGAESIQKLAKALDCSVDAILDKPPDQVDLSQINDTIKFIKNDTNLFTDRLSKLSWCFRYVTDIYSKLNENAQDGIDAKVYELMRAAFSSTQSPDNLKENPSGKSSENDTEKNVP